MTAKIHFPEDEDTIAFVQGLGLDPDRPARELFEEEVRRLRARERHRQLKERGIRLPRPAAEMVREDRGSR